MRIEVRHDRFDATQEPFGLAWSLTSPFTDVGASKFYGDILFGRRSVEIIARLRVDAVLPDGVD